jgi:FlaA1/EpsC-like NDP-sugar epimerase
MISNTLQRYLNLRTLFVLLAYVVICVLSYLISYELRFDFSIPDLFVDRMWDTLWWVVFLQVALLFGFGQFDSVLAYFRLQDLFRVFVAVFAASFILMVLWYLYGGEGVPPRGIILTDMLLCFLGLSGFRLILRIRESRSLSDWFAGKDFENVLIVGAGEVGANLCADLMHKTRFQMRPVAFIDDDVSKIGRYVHGVLVAGGVEELAATAKRSAATKAIIAFPSASVSRVREVTRLASDAGLTVETVPSLSDIMNGRAKMTQLRPVELKDLLGRDPVDLNDEGIRSMLEGKRVLVTGAGGSIGQELVAQILKYTPDSLCCIDQAEIAIFNLEQLLSRQITDTDIEFRVLDILNGGAMGGVFDAFQPEVVFHAAAHKHVNLMEANPQEALRNNFLATKQLAELAGEHSVERFILISTDKAINPTSVMGATKRLAELALLAQQKAAGNTTRFMAVRFGNVLGSSGSVIPIFRKQIGLGGPITVTDPEVTRYFMTVEEAAGLVLQSATQCAGGEIFVLDMGEPMKIVDVARQMISLSGLVEGEDIAIEFCGLRPGEKLYEELQHVNESLFETSHPRVLCMASMDTNTIDLDAVVTEFADLIKDGGAQRIKQAMQRWVPEYTPYLGG